jgi:hypothetical protein
MATTGSGTGVGSYADPFLHLQEFIDVMAPGDTLWMRGGTYDYTSANGNNMNFLFPPGDGASGTKANPICFFNYPGEMPVFDCVNVVSPGNFNTFINVQEVEYINFRGMEIKNIMQRSSDEQYEDTVACVGFNVFDCANMTFERISIHDIGGRGWYYAGGAWDETLAGEEPNPPFESDTTVWLNCDVYNAADTIAESPGNLADGWKAVAFKNNQLTWTGCRVWNVSDDGFDNTREATMIFDNCWAWDIGNYDLIGVNGNGFKVGGARDTVDYETVIMKYCIAAWCYNPAAGVAAGIEWIEYQVGAPDPEDIYYRSNGRVYNSMFYGNEVGIGTDDNVAHQYRNNVYRNCISMNSLLEQDGVTLNLTLYNYLYPESNNSWDLYDPRPGSWPPWFVETDSVTITEADFTTGLDSATIYSRLSAPRQADGSLPSAHPFELAEGSDLIDAGTQIPLYDSLDISLSFYGDAPDMGPFESNYGSTTRKRPHINASGNMLLNSSGGPLYIKEE